MPGGLIRPAFGVYQTADRAALGLKGFGVLFLPLKQGLHDGNVNDSAPICPMRSRRFFRPHFLGCSGRGSSMFKNRSRASFHCSRKALEWTRSRVFTRRCPIR